MAAPQCSDLAHVQGQAIPTAPVVPLGCNNLFPPHIYPRCPGVPIKHARRNPYTVCDSCDIHTTVRLNADPGALANMRVNLGGFSPPLPPPANAVWQFINELATGILGPGRGFPIHPGYLTRMCTDCEDIVEEQHWLYLSGAMPVPRAESLKWQRIPGVGPAGMGGALLWNSCTCLYTTDNNPSVVPVPRPDRLCQRDRRAAWEAVFSQRDVTDKWLRRAFKLERSGKIVEATDKDRRRRVRNGTFRACPCGKDVVPWVNFVGVPPVQPAPRVVSCMGCGGYKCLVIPAAPAIAVSNAAFSRRWSRWRRGIPRIGSVLSAQ